MVNKRYEQVPCPFCYESSIVFMVFGGYSTVKRSGDGKRKIKSSETWVAEHDCPKCKSKSDDIELKIIESL